MAWACLHGKDISCKLQQRYVFQGLHIIDASIVGMAMGRGGAGRGGAGRCRRMGSSSPPRMVLSCHILALHDGENFLTPSLSPRAPLHPIKFYFLLICPTTSTIFLMKPILLINIYLKLQLNVSHQIKSIFRKNWIIYSSV